MNKLRIKGMVQSFGLILLFCFLIPLSACSTLNKQERAEVLADFPGVVCWGDSLTAGAGGEDTSYPSVLQNLVQKNVYGEIEVVNLGVGGESSATICSRAGVYQPLALMQAVTIPAAKEKVEIKLNFPVLRQGANFFNPCLLGEGGGVIGEIVIEQDSISSPQYTYYFKRSEVGKEVSLEAGSIVTTAQSTNYKNYVSIIFIGQNGGWNDDFATLIAQQRALIERQTANAEKYLILGLTTNSAADRAELEKVMQEEYGDKYVNLREYLSGSAARNAGVQLTAEDEEQMAAGIVPQALRVDAVHLNKQGYTMIGNVVYERMKQLGYFDSVIKIREKYAVK